MTGLLASLITSLAAPARPAPSTRGKPRGIPPPDNLRRANAARMALYSARAEHLDAALLAACAAGPRSAVSLAHQLDASPERIKRAARRLAAHGRVRVVMLPYPGRGKVFCVEVCDA